MMSRPQVGKSVQFWYAKKVRDWRPLHGRIGIVAFVCTSRGGKRGGPRNHMVLIDGVLVSVPAGNLRPAPVQEGSVP